MPLLLCKILPQPHQYFLIDNFIIYYYNFRIEILDTELFKQRFASPAESAIKHSIQGTLCKHHLKESPCHRLKAGQMI